MPETKQELAESTKPPKQMTKEAILEELNSYRKSSDQRQQSDFVERAGQKLETIFRRLHDHMQMQTRVDYERSEDK